MKSRQGLKNHVSAAQTAGASYITYAKLNNLVFGVSGQARRVSRPAAIVPSVQRRQREDTVRRLVKTRLGRTFAIAAANGFCREAERLRNVLLSPPPCPVKPGNLGTLPIPFGPFIAPQSRYECKAMRVAAAGAGHGVGRDRAADSAQHSRGRRPGWGRAAELTPGRVVPSGPRCGPAVRLPPPGPSGNS